MNAAAPFRLQLVTFRSLTDTRPRAVDLPWVAAAQRLCAHEERIAKDGPGWSPAIYKPEARRGNDGVEALTALVFDIDHEAPPWELLEEYEYVAYTTHSHTAADSHWRVVLPLSRPVTASAWASVWERARYRLCPNADEACKDEARFYWAPSCLPGAEHEALHHQGRILDPDQLPALPRAAQDVAVVATNRPGDDYNQRTHWNELLEPAGWTLVYTRGTEQRWRRPNKLRGWSATTGYGEHDLLYVFSSSAAPFEPGRSYSKFAAYTLLNHRGDFTDATRALAAKGYGEPVTGTAAKNVTPSAPERRNDGPPDASNLGSGPVAPKSITKAVTPSADILSADGGVPWAQLGCRLGSDVVPEDVRWLWDERLALGKLNLIEGDGGEGKSLVIDDLAARLSAHLPLPDGSPNPFEGKVKVVLLMAEDDAADTIVPRILAAGGDPSNVVVLDRVPDEDGGHFPTIPDDLDHIERVVKAAGARMLAIDPLASYLSEAVNSHNDHSVRRALATLPDLAARNGCAVVVVRHLNKNTAADPKHRGSGAGAFINLARIGLAIGPDPDDSTGARRILAVNKVNIGEQAGALAYHIDTAWVRKSEQDEALIKTARVVWDGPSTLTAADILGAKPDEETRTASEIAKDLLLQLLTEDAQDEEPVWAAVKKAGVSHSSYMRARKALGVKASRVGGLADQGKWQLALPKRTPQVPPSGPDILRPANEPDILRQNPSVPDRETPAQPPKNVTRTGDILSELVGRSAAPPDTCEQPGCVRRPSAVDRGRWVCFSHHPLGSAAATTNGSAA